MEESEAIAFYDGQRSRGAGAAKFKHGLGFGGARPPFPPNGAPRPVGGGEMAHPMMHVPGRPPGMAQPPRPPPQPPNMDRPFLPPQPHMFPPPVFPPPPGGFAPRPGMAPPVRGPLMPPRGPLGHPPPGHMFPPMGPGGLLPRGPDGWAPIPPPRPPMGPPPPLAMRGGVPHGGWRPPPQVLEVKGNDGRMPSEGQTDAFKSAEATKEEKDKANKQKEEESWTAHKSDDGSVYYYNTFTGVSSWGKPLGFDGNAVGVTERPKPVSSERVKGCDWTEVKCEDGRKYYFHVVTQETVWSEPPDVTKSRSIEEAPSKIPPPIVVTPPQARPNMLPPPVRHPPVKMPRVMLSVRKGQPSTKGNQPSEAAVEEFKALLSEKGVNPFSRFEREMPKLEHDERWKGVGSLKEKRLIFDDFCRAMAEDQRKNKEEATKVSVEGFIELLEAIAENEIVQQAERKRKKAADREEGEMETGDSEDDPEIMVPGLSHDTTLEALEKFWGNDPRWRACSPRTRKQLFEERQRPVKGPTHDNRKLERERLEANFKALLQEHGVTSSSRWSKTKQALSEDDRFNAVARADREELFRKHVEGIKLLEEHDRREERDQLAREREMRMRMERDEEEADRRKLRAAHGDAVSAFQTLLGEVVKDPDTMWRDWKHKLERDPQGRATNPALEQRELERLFRDHVKELMDVANREYREVLEEVIRPLFPSKEDPDSQSDDFPPALHTFEAARELMEEDPRFMRASKDSRERLWRRFIEDMFFESKPPLVPGDRDRKDRRLMRDRDTDDRQRMRAQNRVHSERDRARRTEKDRGRDNGKDRRGQRDSRDRREYQRSRDNSPDERDWKKRRP
ncbi:hypothetical protein BSKO_13139 [Bryopsis sp. KO-2023]|nr:hypothetical protein BSKO_13139 [Bryopsis sp. KO-2023]